jgi:hypothetical protein
MLFEQQHLLSTEFQVLSKKKAINFFLKSRISSFHVVEFHDGGDTTKIANFSKITDRLKFMRTPKNNNTTTSDPNVTNP